MVQNEFKTQVNNFLPKKFSIEWPIEKCHMATCEWRQFPGYACSQGLHMQCMLLWGPCACNLEFCRGHRHACGSIGGFQLPSRQARDGSSPTSSPSLVMHARKRFFLRLAMGSGHTDLGTFVASAGGAESRLATGGLVDAWGRLGLWPGQLGISPVALR